MNITLRLETDADHRAVENMVREAFWNVYKPGCDEHLVLHKLRTSPAYVDKLHYVACSGRNIVGNIVYSKAAVESADGRRHEVLCMGPVSVLPEHQRKGIGGMLIRESSEAARAMGYRAVVIFGDPAYYARFGYRNAAEYGIQTSTGENFAAFMVLDLLENNSSDIRGRFHADSAFNVAAEELAEFDKAFPKKEKIKHDGQLF